MSFTKDTTNRAFNAGYFLASADCKRETREIAQTNATTDGNGKFVKAGTIYPANNSTAIGIVYEDVDVTTGNMPGSVVTKGEVYTDRLPQVLDSDAQTALEGLGFKFMTAPTITRPESGTLKAITVTSAAGTAAGDTAITISGYTPGSGESYVYKVGTTTPTISYNAIPDYTWTAWDGTSDITAQTDKKITIASVLNDRVVASGSATVTAKA